jgi:hypothetical protein
MKFGIRKSVLAFAVCAFFSTMSAQAWSWPAADASGWNHHPHLKSTNGVEVWIDYQSVSAPLMTNPSRYAGVHIAKPVWFNVRAPFASSVSVEVNFYEQRYVRSGSDAPIRRVFSHYDRTVQLFKNQSGEFSGATQSLAVERFDSAGNDGYLLYQKIRVLVDGVPLVDPISQTEWFQVLLINR